MSLSEVQLLDLKTQVLTGMTKTALAIDRLDRWLILNEYDDDYNEVEGELLELEAQFHKLNSKLKNLNHTNGRLQPPNESRTQEIIRLSGEVENLILAQATATAMISLAGKTLKLVAEVRKVGTEVTA